VSQIYASVGQAVAKDAPLFAIRTEAALANPTDPPPTTQEIVVAAPAAGVVTRLDLAVGQAVKTTKAGTAPSAASIADLSSVWLAAEIDARPLRPGQPIEARPTALAGRVYKGKILSVSPVDQETMRATARIVVENADGGLKPGMLAQFNLSHPDDAGSLAVPEGAVLFENDSARVFVQAPKASDSSDAGKLTPGVIRTGRIRDGMVEVIEGLALGENVEATDALFIDRAAKGY
jgi:multidrug efflux pump subunit AcrA (membrane-fusion protein)